MNILTKKINAYSGIISEFILINKAKTVVEIGVAKGQSTLSLCEAVNYTNGHVYAFDNWESHGLVNQFPAYSSKETVENMLKSEGFNNFTLFKKNTFDEDFPDYLKNSINSEIDLAFIDACHSYLGCLNDFKAVYPLLSKIGIIVFHDTQTIDGCREFMLDLRTKYFDGTYDIFDLHGGYRDQGISFLIKRQFPTLKIPINQICGSISNPYEIELKESQWYNNEITIHKQNLPEVNEIKLTKTNFGMNNRNYLQNAM